MPLSLSAFRSKLSGATDEFYIKLNAVGELNEKTTSRNKKH